MSTAKPPASNAAAAAARFALPGSAWLWELTGSVIVVAAYAIVRLAGPSWSGAALLAWLVAVTAGLAAVVVGVVAHRPARPSAWWSLAGGLALALVGKLVDLRWPGVRFPSVAHACFLASSALFVIGLLLMARARIVPRHGGAALLGSLIVMVLLLLLILHCLIFPVLIRPAINNPAAPMTARGPGAVYLVSDVLLLGVVALLLVGGRLRPRSSMSAALLVAGVVLVIVNDVGSAVATLAGAPPLEFALLLGVAAVGAAALHPSMRALTEPWDPAAAPAQPSLDWAEVLSLVTVTLLVIAVVLVPLPLDLLLPRRVSPPTAVLATALVAVALPLFAYIAEQTLSAAAQVRRYRRLLAETMRAKEHERQQIAADLHDGTIQRLAAMGFTAERVRRRLARGAVGDADRLVGELAGELEREVTELRGVAVQLRPPVLEALGLAQALREHVDSFQQRTGIRCELDLDPDLDLDLERETILYWAVQELLLNVAKHARARHAWIRLDVAAGTARLSIRDDGVGFDPEALGDLLGQRQFGLAGTRDRVEMVSGTLRIDSQPGQGTTISISLPPPPS